ncbi:MAG TPA: sugar transferase, partial [Pseudothermotoga sp.]|nr:sugar transferase [Pseudothermotoga sp.]
MRRYQYLVLVDYVLLSLINYFLTSSIAFSLIFSVISVTMLFAFRVYETEYLESVNEQLTRTVIALFVSNALKYIFYPFFDKALDLPYVFAHIVLASPSVAVVNYTLNHLFKEKVQSKSYIVIGNKDEVGTVLEEITKKSYGRYRFVEYINPSPVKVKTALKKADGILVADYELYESIRSEIQQNIEIVYLPHLAETILRRIPLEVIEKFKNYYESAFSQAKESPAKRVLDIVCGVIGFAVFSPVMLIVSLCILVEDGRPVIFKQLRIGKDNKPFLMYKFRSMKKEKPDQAKFADEEKDRILKIGKLIRPFRIDESLQFVNIIKGDMSIVGPRPEQVPFARDFEQKIPFYSY